MTAKDVKFPDSAREGRVKQIRHQIEESTRDDDKEKLQERAAKLSGGVAVIRAGAAIEVEMKEKKNRVEDALQASRTAIAEGILAGGGVADLRAREAVKILIKILKGANPDPYAGIQIVMRALEEPLRQIAANAGSAPSVVLSKAIDGKNNFGYTAQTEVYGDLKRWANRSHQGRSYCGAECG